ncbi:hypothetical protein SAMN02745248_02720 [Hathewaya proteolytica DSM 3090]|uniref:Uncharacterized protein n=1 Tax=Hathewaya proteolytica DSM 3090 TaxID=1121331 RepID=A0A1M6T498_9CLOT|nr:hypothetical protein [Hathewaya proteolytica]SHK51608.1 hypothetical protein SAMN02745248_02720 [Hathewaya proteolytica DSM 3090]
MAKNKSKIVSSLMVMTTAMGTLMEGTMAVSAVNNSKDDLWSQAYNYTVKAKTTGLQSDINVARKAINALSEELKTDKKLRDYLTGTLSAMLDPVQQNLFVKLYEIIYEGDMVTKKEKLYQEQINKAREYISQFGGCEENAYYLPSWSVVIDDFQQKIINDISVNIKKVKERYELDDIETTTKLINDFLKVKESSDVKLKARELNIEFLSTIVKGNKIIDFRKSYSSLIDKKNEQLKVEDKKSIQLALDYIETIPEDMRSILNDELGNLKEKKTRVDKLLSETLPYYPPVSESINSVEKFKKDYSHLFNMTLDEKLINNKQEIKNAIEKFNSLSKSDKENLKNEEIKLTSLVNFINQFIEKAVFTFKTDYRELLEKTVDTVVLADKNKISEALKELEISHYEIKSKLSNEEDILKRLNAKLSGELLSQLNVSVKGKMVTISGKAVEYDDNGMVLIIKNIEDKICYFDQVNMNKQGEFSISFDFTNNISGVANSTGAYNVFMRLQNNNTASKELNFSIENIVKLEVEEFTEKNKDVIVDMNKSNVKIGHDVRIKEVIAEIATLSPSAQKVLEEKKIELEGLLVIIAGKNVDKEVENFRTMYNTELSLTVETVKVEHREKIQGAIDEYQLLSEKARELLVKESQLFADLMKKINELRIDVDAADFTKSYKDILQKTTDTVQSGDKETILAAIAKYDDLQPGSKDIVDSKSELTTHGKIKEHLQKLMDKVNALVFKNNHDTILKKSVDGLLLGDEADLKAAEDEYAGLNDVSKGYLSAESELMESFRSHIEKLKEFEQLKKTIVSAKSVKKEDEPSSNINEGDKIVGSWDIFQNNIAMVEKTQVSDTKENITKAISQLKKAMSEYENSNVALINAVGVVDGRINGKIGETVEVIIPLEKDEVLRTVNDYVYDLNGQNWSKVATKKTTASSLLLGCLTKTYSTNDAKITLSIQNTKGNVIKVVQLYVNITEKTMDDKVQEFKESHKSVFDLTIDTVGVEHEESIKAVISQYNGMQDVNLKNALVTDVENLNALLGVISAKKAEKFRSDFNSLLSLTVETVTLENRTDIISALSVYGELDESTKNKLVEEKTKLDALKGATDKAAVEKDADDFTKAYARLSDISEENVTIDDENWVISVKNAYSILQEASKSKVNEHFGANVYDKLNKLQNKIGGLKDTKIQIEEERKNLSLLISNMEKYTKIGYDNGEVSPYEGSSIGEIIKGSKQIFTLVVDEAKRVRDNVGATLKELEDASIGVNGAYNTMINSKVKEVAVISKEGKKGDRIKIELDNELLGENEKFEIMYPDFYYHDDEKNSYVYTAKIEREEDNYYINCMDITSKSGKDYMSTELSIIQNGDTERVVKRAIRISVKITE